MRSKERNFRLLPILKTMQNTQLQAMQNQNNALLEALKTSQSAPSPLGGIDWQPIVQGALTGLAQSFGAQVSFPSPTTKQTTAAPATTSTDSSILSKLEILSSIVSQQGKAIEQQGKILEELSSTVSHLSQGFNTLTQLVAATTGTPSNNSGSNNSNESSSSSSPAPAASSDSPSSSSSAAPAVSPKFSPPEITPLEPYKGKLDLTKIVTADLESLINQNGSKLVYMAAWYNGKESKIFDITSYNYETQTMLKEFWLDLINNNIGSTLYFHNWTGYDAILSLIPLLDLHVHGFNFIPLMQNGQLISLKILKEIKGKNKTVLTIKDSLKLLPGSLAQLAKDFQVPTQKDHFPHYFLVEGNVAKTLSYEGPLPDYKYFEAKRTSQVEYAEMEQEFKINSKPWNFIEISQKDILGDVESQYQILVQYFKTLREAFPINPMKNLSVPGIAFTTWRTVKLPLLNKEGFKVYDLSRSLDNRFRGAYLGGIVDVYKPHLLGKGYYYDVNSLYPTAMCRPMQVGMPTPAIITPSEFKQGQFFGFLEATVQAPLVDTPSGYIGLLPIRYNNRLVCPGGTFKGFFFSEELKFAQNNGYTILGIGEAYAFQRGVNTFKTLIEQLNTMKVKAQLEGKSVLRAISKLEMNSMYGRFGMHTPELKHAIVNSQQLDKLIKDSKILEHISLGTLDLITYALDTSLKDFSKSKDMFKLRKYLKGLPGQTNVPISAAVASYSRIIINELKLLALNLKLNIYYSDTDSLVVDGPLPENLLDSATLGMLKLEHRFSEGIFVMPKVYFLELENGRTVTKCKGYSGRLSKQHYLELLKGDVIELNVTRWRRSLELGTVQIMKNLPYRLNPQLNKRNKVFDLKGKWIDTLPLLLDTC